MPVRAVRAAVVAGVLVLAFVVALYTVRPVPDAIVRLLGGPTGIERIGGVRIVYRPAPGTEETIARLTADADVRVEGGALVLEYPGVQDEAARAIADVLLYGGLEFRVVIERDDYAATISQDGTSEDVIFEVDQWRPDDGGELRTDYFLIAESEDALQAAIEAARARGWSEPPNTQLVTEWVDAAPGAKGPRNFLRTYLVSSEVALDGSSIANAIRSYDPNTNRPIVLLDFNREGGERFCELTGRIQGGKLATIVGGRVKSAPIINGQICGGRASITMGGSDAAGQEAEADGLAAVLQRPWVPPGGQVEDHEYIEPANIAAIEWLGRLLLGIAFGAAFALLTFVVIRVARPTRAPAPPRPAGPFPWARLAVTGLAPLALTIGADLPLPGVNGPELEHVLQRELGEQESMIALGVTPVITAFLLVEIVALLITPLRWRRHDPVGRAKLGKAIVVVAVVVAAVQSYFMARNYETLGTGFFGGPSLLVDNPDWQFRIVFMLSLTAGTLLLAVVAGMISEHGLGNGYAVLLASALVFDVGRPLFIDGLGFDYYLHATTKLGMATAAVIAIATVFALRWRVSILRVPTSGVSPLVDSASLIYLGLTLVLLAGGPSLVDTMQLVARVQANTWLAFAILVVTIPIWAWLFARPSLVEEPALRAGIEAPTLATWLRATLLTLLFVGATGAAATIATVTDAGVAVFASPLAVMLVTAAVLDIIADARARRAALVPVAVVHQVQWLSITEQLLAAAQIPYHLHASHVRTLYAFFGPWAPVVVLVPAEHREAARQKLDPRMAAFD